MRNNVEAGVLEPAISKTKMIQVRAHRTCTVVIHDRGWLQQRAGTAAQ